VRWLLGTLAVLTALAVVSWRHPQAQWLWMSRMSLPQLETRLVDEPNDWRLHYWYGLRAAEAGEYERAETPLRRAFGTEQSFLPAAVELGRVLLAQGKIDEAFQVLSLVIGRDADNLEAHLALGQLYRSQGAHHRALQELDLVLKQKPDYVPALYERAAAQSGIQKPKEAEADLRLALSKEPKNSLVLTALSRIRREDGDVAEARALAEKAVALAPGTSPPLLELGRIQSLLEPAELHRKEAIATLERAASLDPRNPTIHFELAQLHYAAQRWAEALRELELCVQYDPGLTQAYYLVSRCLNALGREPEARRVSAVFNRKQRYDQQTRDLASRLGAKPGDISLRLRLGELHAGEGYLDRAIDTYRIALQWEPKNEKARKRLAELVRQKIEKP